MEPPLIVKTIKKVLPAVVSITVSKYLTIFGSPFGSSPIGRGLSRFHRGGSFPFEFEEFFMVPRGKKKIKIGGGSGFIVNNSGIILTNRHVVADPKAEYVVILNDGRKYKAEILAKDPINDVAIIKIDAKNLSIIELGDSSKLELGQTAIAIGNTLGTFQNTVSSGVVSGLSREITAAGSLDGRAQRLKGLVQTDAAINPGNSGGPLIDIEGKVIGINAAMVFGAENVGFALPVNNAKKDLEDLKKFGKIRHPFLGVRYLLLDKEIQEKYNLPLDWGALVISESIPEGQAVVPGSPADKTGLREGDIILEIEDEKISQKSPLEDILQKFQIGQMASLKVFRNGREAILKIKIGER
jgi:S1-C subfamily serine protease